MTNQNIELVKDYYNKSQKWSSLFYSDKESLGIHYGLWGQNSTRSEALTNTYRKIVSLLNIKSKDKVLDAGCGIGGAIFWLAKNYGISGTGITISDTQLKKANHILKQLGLKNTTFLLMNYFSTSFNDGEFDKIFGIESLCHAYPEQEKVYREMYRILKPGGKFAIIDGVIKRKPNSDEESKNLNEFINGYALNTMCTPEEIIDALKLAGFNKIQVEDHTPEIAKSVRDIHIKGIILKPLYLLYALGLASAEEERNYHALKSQKKVYDSGLFGYYTFVAEK